MKHKILLLNVTLLAATIFTGFQLRRLYVAEKARESAALRYKLNPAPPPPVTPLTPAPAVLPSNYAEIATKTLFHKERNPTVVVVVPPPPPPKPVPPFPVLKGMMNLGDGLTAVFAEKSGSPGKEVKPGEPIGQFMLIAVNEQEAVFGWDGKTYRKRVEEILDRSRKEDQDTSRPAAPPPGAAPPPVAKVATGPGAETGAGTRACNVNDSTPEGAVVDGYRKVSANTPFGKACRWEAVSR